MAEAWKKWEGQVVNGEFHLLKYLGGSERSAVFLSERGEREPRQVAIKLVRASAENPELQVSWWELASKLSHPHLLRLFQRGRCQVDGTDLFYAVMEYAEESLAQILPYRPLTPAEAHDTLRPLLDALTYVHARGFVHGHIKPSNVMAVSDQIKLSSDELCGAGESGRVLGTLGTYAAPEVANGGGMSAASDVWSLGMTMVEALTQRRPASEGASQTELVLPDTIPEPFFDIASHCLRRDPQRRWTVAEIEARLQGTQPSSLPRSNPDSRKPPARWGYVAAAAAAGVLLWALLSPRLHNRHPGGQPEASSIESSKPAAAPGQTAGTGQSVQPPSSQRNAVRASAPSNAPRSASSNVTTKNSPSDAAQGAVVQQVMPEVSRYARNTIQGKVRVRVKVMVDSSGKVVITKFDSHGPSKYFADRAMQAARQWTFRPPQVDGQGVPSEWLLKFEFGRVATNVYPSQTSP